MTSLPAAACGLRAATRTTLATPARSPSLLSRRCNASQASRTQQQTETVREMGSLMAEVRGTLPQRIKVRMPTRLAPKRSWVNEVHAQPGDTRPIELTPELEAELLKPKHMAESYVELWLPFRDDPELLEKYIATSGMVRLGKILEDLDTLAGAISYQHALGAAPRAGDVSAPLYIVTASVDRLDLLEPLRADANYRLSGHVIYVGSSSMEVFVSIERLDNLSGPAKVCLTGRAVAALRSFTMAARNASTLKSQKIAPLLVETDAEKRLYAIGEGFKKRKRQEAATSLERVPPTKDEAVLLHSQYLEGLRAGLFSASDERHGGAATAAGADQHLVPVSKTALSATMHLHPQQRNVHGKVFGGFLMRSAYELAWMVAASFVHRQVQFLSLDALSFHAPVPIGAILRLSSQVTYSDESGDAANGKHAVAGVSVLAEVVNLETGVGSRSNTNDLTFRPSRLLLRHRRPRQFHFSFDVGPPTRRVMPQTYKEAMEWIEGKRRVELGHEMRALYGDGA
ncbi:related to acyl-coa thioester hydrolase [Pseudozyma flocculosa]|uniref:Related to acyl-coa thioester hydrolase n=1 Tax=Pseudozyma flocculosa TaxID=84751 RepID=A0A5C3F6L6_9BASI|nr:related to acyl-coa thioester hydrolase [Pseudozyma flocculosa]